MTKLHLFKVPAETEEVKLSFPHDFKTLELNWDGASGKISLDGRVPAFCAEVQANVTISGADVILTRFLLQDGLEADYWADPE